MVVFIIPKPNSIPEEIYNLGKRVEDDTCLWLRTSNQEQVAELLIDCTGVRVVLELGKVVDL